MNMKNEQLLWKDICRDSNTTRQCDCGNRLPIGVTGHLNPCYADMIDTGEQNRTSFGSPPPYDALAFGIPVMPPAYASDETSLPSYSAAVSSQHTGNSNIADSMLPTSRNEQMPKTDVSIEGQKWERRWRKAVMIWWGITSDILAKRV